MNPLAAVLLTRETWELIGLIALGITLLGVWLNWRRQSMLEDFEEHVKNGKLEPDQAWHRARLVNWLAPTVIFSGVALLLVAMAGLAL